MLRVVNCGGGDGGREEKRDVAPVGWQVVMMTRTRQGGQTSHFWGRQAKERGNGYKKESKDVWML